MPKSKKINQTKTQVGEAIEADAEHLNTTEQNNNVLLEEAKAEAEAAKKAQEEAEEEAAKAKAEAETARKAQKEAEENRKSQTAQYGKRGSTDYAQLSVQIPKELRKDFKQRLLEYETDASSIIEELITNWLSSKSK